MISLPRQAGPRLLHALLDRVRHAGKALGEPSLGSSRPKLGGRYAYRRRPSNTRDEVASNIIEKLESGTLEVAVKRNAGISCEVPARNQVVPLLE